jgi:hypothetical protein
VLSYYTLKLLQEEPTCCAKSKEKCKLIGLLEAGRQELIGGTGSPLSVKHTITSALAIATWSFK